MSGNAPTPPGDETLATSLGTQAAPPPPRVSPVPPREIPPGARLGRYEVLGLLGAGGMGVVLLARDPMLAREVALKVLHEDAGPIARARFLREARAVAALDHPQIVRIYDLGDEPDGRCWFAMQRLPGPTLASRLSQGLLPVPLARALASDLCCGLAYAHSLGLVHRDIKPSNVLLEERDGRLSALLADFGLVERSGAHADRLTLSGEVLGTPMYMAPEQARSDAANPAADVYSMGAVLYEMLAGQPPYAWAAPIALLLRKLSEPPVPLELRAPDCPAELVAIVKRAMAPEPGARFVDAGAMLAALRASSPVESPRPDPVTQLSPALPAERDRFVGREADLRAIGAAVASARLITLLGPGGMGKTRLATRFAWSTRATWPGGAWFCDLCECRDLDALASAVARTLDVPLGKDPPLPLLGYAIAGRGRCLIVLDNLEQVLGPARVAVQGWMEAAPEATFLVTSRERLGIDEHVLLIGPLEADPAASLFNTRAAAAGRPAPTSDEERATIARLVSLLDGMPLPIELAAARARVLSPAQILSRLSDRFRLLAGGRGPDRHVTLRAAIDWSWELLTEEERLAFAQCAVFAGGFTMEAAEAVLAVEGAWPLDLIQSLVDKSLVRVDGQSGGDPRLSLFVSLAQYASERLEEQLDEAARRELRTRHARFYAALDTDAISARGGAERWRALALEQENLGRACRHALETGDGDLAARAALVMARVAQVRGPFSPAADQIGRVLPCAPPALARALRLQRAQLLHLQGRWVEALPVLDTLIAEPDLDVADRIEALNQLGTLGRRAGQPELGLARYEQARQLAAASGGTRQEARALAGIAAIFADANQLDEARPRFQAALLLYRQIGHALGEATTLESLGAIACMGGRLDVGKGHLDDALRVYREVGYRKGEGGALMNLGALALESFRLAEARAALEEALRIQREIGYRLFVGQVLGSLGILHLWSDDLDAAERRLREAAALHQELENPMGLALWRSHLAALARRRGQPELAAALAREALSAGRPFQREATEARVELARALGAMGQHAEAEAFLHEGLAEAPDREHLHVVPLLLALGELALARQAHAEAWRWRDLADQIVVRSGISEHTRAARELRDLTEALALARSRDRDPRQT